MIILGINEDHNSTIAIVKDGVVLYSASEERISRVKNDVGYPFQSIANALKEAGINANEIDYVAYTCKTVNPLDLKIKRITRFKISDYIREMHEFWKPTLIDKCSSKFWQNIMNDSRFNIPEQEYYDFSFLKYAPEDEWNKEFQKQRISVVAKQLGIDSNKVLFIKHHTCHAYYAFYASPIDHLSKTAVITADGWGDGENGTIWMAEHGKLKKIHSTSMCNLARFYRYATLLLGMKPYEHEYKVMGLAPYAKDYLMQPVYEIYKNTLEVDGIDFKWKEKPGDMYFYFQKKFEGLRFDGIAAGVQKWIEDMLVLWVSNILKYLNSDSLVFSGGLAMNVKANKAISEIPQLKEFFVPPSSGDESTAIGAAFFVSKEHGQDVYPLAHGYLGYEVTDSEVKSFIQNNNIKENYQVTENVSLDKIAKLLEQNKIIARCAHKMEFGARALGNRSIICNPSNFDNIQLLNDKIKFRDFWMPFTPSILDYRATDYLINPKNLKAPYMTIAFDTTELGRKHLRAAIHPHDLTARPQVVEEKVNYDYYSIIQAFEKRTGIGCVLNTSLNLHGEPIVRNVEDAWHVFVDSGLDALLLNNVLIEKK